MFNLFRKKEYKLSKCYERYFDDVEANMRLARSSIAKYKEVALKVIAIIGDIDVRDIDESSITNLKREMNAKELSSQRKNHLLVTLKNVLGYLINQEKLKVLEPSKITKFRVSQKEVEYLAKKELIQLASAPNPNTITGSRNQAIIEAFISTGCRVAELTSINRNQMNFETGIMSIRTKGDKPHQIIFNKSSLDAIKRYLDKRTDDCEALFATTHTDSPKRLQINDIQRSLRNLGRKLGFSINVTPHCLRRSSATLMFKEGVPLGVIQKFLNHSSSQVTTRFYLGNLDFEDLKKNHERVMNFDFDKKEVKGGDDA
jgi:integrase/recombinase XerD